MVVAVLRNHLLDATAHLPGTRFRAFFLRFFSSTCFIRFPFMDITASDFGVSFVLGFLFVGHDFLALHMVDDEVRPIHRDAKALIVVVL